MRNFIFVFAAVFGGVAACGGADSIDVINGNPNAVVNEADASADVNVIPKNDGGPNPNCDPGKCGLSAPQGWTLATAHNSRATPCADGWKTIDVVADPVADPAACSCSCNVTQPPTCGGGTVLRNLDTGNASCSQIATTLNMTGGGTCDQFPNFFITLQGKNYQTIPPGPKGGVCQFDAKSDTSKVTAAEGRICEPPPSCQGDICKMQNICITHDGNVDCPVEFANKRLVGDAPKLECAACGGACDVKGACSGTLNMYTDDSCSQGKIDFPADATCAPSPNGNNMQYRSGSLTTSVKNAGCAQIPPASAASVKLDAPTTVCCKK